VQLNVTTLDVPVHGTPSLKSEMTKTAPAYKPSTGCRLVLTAAQGTHNVGWFIVFPQPGKELQAALKDEEPVWVAAISRSSSKYPTSSGSATIHKCDPHSGQAMSPRSYGCRSSLYPP
jgi:hypothetical protein